MTENDIYMAPAQGASTKEFSESIFDVLQHNMNREKEESFRKGFDTEWNGDHQSLDFFALDGRGERKSEDGEPDYRLVCVDGHKQHPVILWVYWCSNYTTPETWIREIWPGNVEKDHFLNKFRALRNRYSGDEAMNRFFRELSPCNQKKLYDYVCTRYSC